MPHKQSPSPVTDALPRIDLHISEDDFKISVSISGTNPPQVFPLPPLPTFLLEWVTTLHHEFWKIEARCMGSALLLDFAAMQWMASIPHQRPGPDAPSLQINTAELAANRPSRVLAGSFSTLRSADPRCFSDDVPNFPGLHFLQVFEGEANGLWGFLRSTNQCALVKRERVVFEDREKLLNDNVARMILA